MISCIVDSAIRIPRALVSDGFERHLRGVLSVDNPEFTRRKRMGLWIGQTDRRLSAVDLVVDDLVAPRGTNGASRPGEWWGRRSPVQKL